MLDNFFLNFCIELSEKQKRIDQNFCLNCLDQWDDSCDRSIIFLFAYLDSHSPHITIFAFLHFGYESSLPDTSGQSWFYNENQNAFLRLS